MPQCSDLWQDPTKLIMRYQKCKKITFEWINATSWKKRGKCCSIFQKQNMMKKPKTKFEVGGNKAILFLDIDKTGFIGCFVLSMSILMWTIFSTINYIKSDLKNGLTDANSAYYVTFKATTINKSSISELCENTHQTVSIFKTISIHVDCWKYQSLATLRIGKLVGFHPFYKPRMPLGWVEV